MTPGRISLLFVALLCVTGRAGAWQTDVAPFLPATGFNVAGTVLTDADENVIAGGAFSVFDPANPDHRNAGVVKLSGADGREIWRTILDTGAGGTTSRIELDPSGNVVLAGLALSANQTYDILVAKLAKEDGHVLWSTRINGTANKSDFVRDLDVDGVGNVVVGGNVANTTGHEIPFLVVKLSGANGVELWRKEISSDNPLDDDANDVCAAVAFDQNNDVIAAGAIDSFPFDNIFVVAKLKGSDGEELWRNEDLSANVEGFVSDMVLDAAGNAVVVGAVRSEVYYAKVANNGMLLWRKSDVAGMANAVALDAFGDLIVVGERTRPSGEVFVLASSIYARKVAGATGDAVWTRDFPTIGQVGSAAGVVVDQAGNYVVVGETSRKKKGFAASSQVVKLAAGNGATIFDRIFLKSSGTAIALNAQNEVVVTSLGFTVTEIGPPAEGKGILVKGNPEKLEKRKLQVQVKDDGFVPATPGASGDPSLVGALLTVRNPTTNEQMSLSLPPVGWIGAGKPAGAKGWKYKLKGDPCAAVIKAGQWQVTCVGSAVSYTLDEPSQGSLAAKLTIGTESSCVVFGGEIKKDLPNEGKKGGTFQAKNAPAPAACL